MSTDEAVAQRPAALSAEDPRRMLPIAEVAALLDVSVRTLQRLHDANPAAYPAQQVGDQWRIPRWWVERQIACEAP